MEALELAGDIYAAGPDEAEYPELWDDLVGLWSPSWSGPTGLELIDFSGNQNNGTLTNMDAATDWVVGEKGYVLDYDGSNDFVQITEKKDLFLGNNFSIATWINADSSTNSLDTILMKSDDAANNITYGLFFIGTTLNFVVGTGTSRQIIADDYSSFVDNWHYIVGIRNGSDLKVWVDAIEFASGSMGPDTYDSTNDLMIGDGVNAFTPFIGQIDDISIYNRALEQQEISAMFAGASPLTPRRRRVMKAPVTAGLLLKQSNMDGGLQHLDGGFV